MKFFPKQTNLPENLSVSRDKTLSDHSGFTLIETLVAIAILTIVAAGLMNLVSQSAQTGQRSQDRAQAVHLAAEAIELLRAQRDEAWLSRESFDDWVKSIPTACITSQNLVCRIDARPGEDGDVENCGGGGCDPLTYDSFSGMYGHGSGNPTRFTRSIGFNTYNHDGNGSNDEELEIIVSVSWAGPGLDGEVVLRESLFSWFPFVESQ